MGELTGLPSRGTISDINDVEKGIEAILKGFSFIFLAGLTYLSINALISNKYEQEIQRLMDAKNSLIQMSGNYNNQYNLTKDPSYLDSLDAINKDIAATDSSINVLKKRLSKK